MKGSHCCRTGWFVHTKWSGVPNSPEQEQQDERQDDIGDSQEAKKAILTASKYSQVLRRVPLESFDCRKLSNSSQNQG